MRFSVVIPVYNRAKIVGEAIRSVLDQTVEDFEIIVVDDGSTDGTAEVVREQYGSEVRLLRQENKGPGAARNRGIGAARGEYITFLDSDDLWFPWTLSVFDKAIRRNGKPSFVVGTRIDAELGSSPDPADYKSREYSDRKWADYFEAAADHSLWVGTPSSVAVRHDLLRSVGGFMSAHVNAEDSDLWMRLGTAPGFVRIGKPSILIYRRHENSAIQDLKKTYQGIERMIQTELSSKYPGGSSRARERRKILTRHSRAASLTLARAGHLEEACFLYRRTFQWNWSLGRLKYLLGAPLFGLMRFTSSP